MDRLRDCSEMKEAAQLLDELLAQAQADRLAGGTHRQDRLQNLLETMCRRGSFTGAVLADGHGLPLVAHRCPLEPGALAAFTSVLSNALDKASVLLGEESAPQIGLDTTLTEKAVLRRFLIAEQPHYLLVFCPQTVDERSELELSLEQLATVLVRPVT